MKQNSCQSCLMPFAKDTGTREDQRYCSLCFKDGKFCYEGDLKGFQKVCYDAMCKNGMNPLVAKIFAWSIRFAPRWKKAA